MVRQPGAAVTQKNSWKATEDTWKRMDIRDTIIFRGSGVALAGRTSADTLLMLFPKESSVTTASRQCRESSTATGYSSLRTPLTKKYPDDYEKRKQLHLEKEKPVLEAF